MAAGNFIATGLGKLKMLNQTVKLSSDTFHVVLTNSAVVPALTYTGTSANAQYSDISGSEVVGTGYTSGGAATTVTLAQSAGTVTASCTGASWTSATVTAKYAWLVDWTSTNKDIVGGVDLDTSAAGGDSSTNGTFSVTFASGLFTV